jgi:hypothetical protein
MGTTRGTKALRIQGNALANRKGRDDGEDREKGPGRPQFILILRTLCSTGFLEYDGQHRRSMDDASVKADQCVSGTLFCTDPDDGGQQTGKIKQRRGLSVTTNPKAFQRRQSITRMTTG